MGGVAPMMRNLPRTAQPPPVRQLLAGRYLLRQRQGRQRSSQQDMHVQVLRGIRAGAEVRQTMQRRSLTMAPDRLQSKGCKPQVSADIHLQADGTWPPTSNFLEPPIDDRTMYKVAQSFETILLACCKKGCSVHRRTS